MRAPFLFGLLFLALPLHAQSVKDTPWWTGEKLLRQLFSGPPNAKGNFDLTPDQYLDSETARAYIEATHDLTEGKAWCYSKRYHPGPDALLDDIMVGLRKLPQEQLKRNAGELITEIWSKKWPCPERGKPR